MWLLLLSLSLAAVFCMIALKFHLPPEAKRTQRCFVGDNRIIFHGHDLRAGDFYRRYEIRCRMKHFTGTEPVCVKHDWRHCWRMPLNLRAPVFVFITKNDSEFLSTYQYFLYLMSGPLPFSCLKKWPPSFTWHGTVTADTPLVESSIPEQHIHSSFDSAVSNAPIKPMMENN